MKERFFQTLAILATFVVTGGTSMADNKPNLSLMSNFAEQVFVNKDLNNLGVYMHDDYIQHNPFVEQGSEGFKTFFNNWFSAIPDFNYELKNIISNDDFIWVYGSYSGTHTNEWLGIPASHAAYKFDAVDIFRVENGKLAEHWDVLDLYNLFKQLGSMQ